MRLTNVHNVDVRTLIIEVSKLKQVIEMAEAVQQVLVKLVLKIKYQYARELSWYMSNNSTTFHHTDSMSVMTIAILSLKSELLSQYKMPNALIDVMSLNDTLEYTLPSRS